MTMRMPVEARITLFFALIFTSSALPARLSQKAKSDRLGAVESQLIHTTQDVFGQTLRVPASLA